MKQFLDWYNIMLNNEYNRFLMNQTQGFSKNIISKPIKNQSFLIK